MEVKRYAQDVCCWYRPFLLPLLLPFLLPLYTPPLYKYYWTQLLAIIGNYCFSQPQKEAQEPTTSQNNYCLSFLLRNR